MSTPYHCCSCLHSSDTKNKYDAAPDGVKEKCRVAPGREEGAECADDDAAAKNSSGGRIKKYADAKAKNHCGKMTWPAGKVCPVTCGTCFKLAVRNGRSTG